MKTLRTSSTRRTEFILLLAASAALLVCLLLNLCLGAVSMSPVKALSVMLKAPDTTLESRVVWYSRLPRTLAAMLVGACLAVSGCLIQTVLNNPLAAPNIIGINAGAGLTVTLICAFLPAMSGYIPLAAFAGALAAALLVSAVGTLTGASRLTLVLCGVMMTSLLNAGIDAVLSFVPNALSGYTDLRIGSFSGVTMSKLYPVVIPAFVLLALTLTTADAAEVMSLGNDQASTLGMRVKPLRVLLLMLASALAGLSVSVAGILGFVGLIVPHIAHRLVRSGMRPRLVFCMLGGALLTALCDLLSRTIFAPYELSVGVMLSFVGVPFFLWLLFKQRGGRTHA